MNIDSGSDAYEILAGRIGYADSGIIKKILRILMPEEWHAEIAIEMPAPVEEVAVKVEKPQKEVEDVLEQMKKRGVIVKSSLGFFFVRDVSQLYYNSISVTNERSEENSLSKLWKEFYGMSEDEKEVLGFSKIDVGQKIGPIEWTATEEEIDAVLESMGSASPWCWSRGPKRKKVVPTIICSKFYYKLLQSEFELYGPKVTTGVHYSQEDEYFHPIKIGETITLEGKILDKISRKGRKYIEIEVSANSREGVALGVYRTIEEVADN
jgi:hypothetical protein